VVRYAERVWVFGAGCGFGEVRVVEEVEMRVIEEVGVGWLRRWKCG
jgi:hypothetical protein